MVKAIGWTSIGPKVRCGCSAEYSFANWKELLICIFCKNHITKRAVQLAVMEAVEGEPVGIPMQG